MDTREKIVPLEQVAARLGGAGWLAVVGTFDPLTLAQADRLTRMRASGKPILAVVERGSASLLSVEARAILIAALKSVELVVIAETPALAEYPLLEIVHDPAGDRERSAAFANHIKGRQRAT